MKKTLLVGLLVSFFGVFLMSHNVSATARRLGNYYSYRSNGVSGLPSNGNIEHNRDYSLTATANNYIYIANGRFVVSDFLYKENTKFYISIVQNFTATTTSVSKASLGAEPFDIYNDYVYTINDAVSYNRSCANSSNCTITVMHNLELQGIGNGTGDLFTIGNLFSTTGWTQSNSGTGVFNWTGYIFEDYDEWAEFRTGVLNSLDNINSDTTDIVNILDDIYDRLDVLDSNADANAQAWDNMQNTDGLVDTGDTAQLLSIVGVITTVFDQIKNAPMSESCSIDANFSRLFGDANTSFNMGAINLCHTLPGWVADIGGFVMTTITFVAVLFMLIGCVNAINNYMDWLRRN